MPLPRSLPFRAVRLRPARPQKWQRAGRRYASTTEKAQEAAKSVGSDLSWIVGSIVVTVPATYLVSKGGNFSNPFSYPKPGAAHHGEHDEHEEGEEEEEEEEGEKEQSGEDDEEKSDDGEEKAGDDEEKAEGSEEKSDEGQEQPDDGEEKPDSGEEKPDNDDGSADDKPAPKNGKTGGDVSKGVPNKEQKGDDPATKEWPEDGSSRKLMLPDKGGMKKRVESPNAIKQDDAGDSEGSDDKAAASKTPVKGQMSGKQKGLSNTDTKHSTDVQNDSGKSKKGEGAPETAKLQGTVDPNRKQV